VEKMKMLRFILYVILHGKLIGRPVNFKAIEDESLKMLPIKRPKESLYQKIRDNLAHNTVTGQLVSNLVYLKNLSTQNKNFFFVDALQLGYLRIFKSASTSILRTLIPLIDPNVQDQTLTDKQVDLLASHYSSIEISSKEKRYHLFTIVRNPFQRLVSAYLDLLDPENPQFGYKTYLFGILKRGMSFPEFVKAVSIIPDNLKSGHLAPQINIIEECGGLKKIKCYRIDKDKELLETFLKSMGLKLNHSNKHKAHYDYRTYYNNETAEMVYKLYHKDVIVFEYQKEFESLLSKSDANT
jgi:hypothetical protein